jgi:hypothetical protein
MIPIVIQAMAHMMSVPMDSSHGILYLYFILYIYRWLIIHPKKLLRRTRRGDVPPAGGNASTVAQGDPGEQGGDQLLTDIQQLNAVLITCGLTNEVDHCHFIQDENLQSIFDLVLSSTQILM